MKTTEEERVKAAMSNVDSLLEGARIKALGAQLFAEVCAHFPSFGMFA